MTPIHPMIIYTHPIAGNLPTVNTLYCLQLAIACTNLILWIVWNSLIWSPTLYKWVLSIVVYISLRVSIIICLTQQDTGCSLILASSHVSVRSTNLIWSSERAFGNLETDVRSKSGQLIWHQDARPKPSPSLFLFHAVIYPLYSKCTDCEPAHVCMHAVSDVAITCCHTTPHHLQVANHRVKTFSGGMKRRLSVALSFLGDPCVIFLDEPTTGMDPKIRRDVWNLILRMKQNRVMIMTTHSMEEADILGDTVAIMANGQLKWEEREREREYTISDN